MGMGRRNETPGAARARVRAGERSSDGMGERREEEVAGRWREVVDRSAGGG